MSRLFRLSLTLAAVMLPPRLAAQANADPESAAIVATARNYIDGFLTGDTTRMRSALRPELAKRQMMGGDRAPTNMTDDILVQNTSRMPFNPSAAKTPADSITIYRHEGDMALVRIGAPTWVDYLQLGKFGSEWKIVNVLWQMRPRS